eukprot:6325273-Amphidinium_carterae.1
MCHPVRILEHVCTPHDTMMSSLSNFHAVLGPHRWSGQSQHHDLIGVTLAIHLRILERPSNGRGMPLRV